MLFRSLTLPPIKKDSLIIPADYSEKSEEDILFIKDAKDLDNIDSRVTNPSINSKFPSKVYSVSNQNFTSIQNMDMIEDNSTNKVSNYLSK